jgi:hypothetical protein
MNWRAVMNKRDEMTVETFVGTGMDLETIYTCFPDFPREEIAIIYNRCKAQATELEGGSTGMSINCS